MAQIIRKWIEDGAVNNEKIDEADIYTITGLRVDSTDAVGRVGIGITDPLDALHIRRSDTSAGLILDLNDGSNGRSYQVYSGASGVLNIKDHDSGIDRLTLLSTASLGNVGITTVTPLDTLHARATVGSSALRLDLDDGLSGQAYQLASNPAGDFAIIDLDTTATRLTFDSTGTMLVPGDATFSGNFEVNGTVTVINTEIFIADELELNQTDGARAALIASQDNNAATETVVKFENASSSNHAFTVDRGNVGFGTTDPQAELAVEGDIVGKLTATPSNIGSTTRRIGTLFMASNIDYESNLDLSVGGSPKITFDTTNGRVGIGSTLPDEPLTVIGNIRGSTTVVAGTGITATTGNIVATAGQVNAGSTMTAGTGITATTGNIVATAGSVLAKDMTATTGDIVAVAGNLGIAGGAAIGGPVGIGTIGPLATLHVEGNIIGKGDNLSELGAFDHRFNKLYMASTVDYFTDLTFDSTGTKVTFTTAGLVGIGTAPAANLHVYGASAIAQVQSSIGTDPSYHLRRSGTLMAKFTSDAADVTLGSIVSANLNLVTDNKPAIQINGGDQKVGIGTAPNTSAKLHLYGATNCYNYYQTADIDTNIGMRWYYGSNLVTEFETIRSSGNYITTIGAYSGELRLRSGAGATAVVVDSAGQVGIGTAPVANLHVYGAALPEIRIQGDVATLNTLWFVQGADSIGSVQMQGHVTPANRKFYSGPGAGGENHLLYGNGASGIVINNTGDVGIGTTNPTQGFHVYDSGSGAVQTLVQSGNRNVNITLMNSDGNAADFKVIGNATPADTKTYVGPVGGGQLHLRYNTGTTGLVILADGKVGIGTTIPITNKLEVYGSVQVTDDLFVDKLLYLKDTTAPVAGSVGYSKIWAQDDTGTSEAYVMDGAGNATKFSPHNPEGDWEFFSRNVKTKKITRINMMDMVREVESLSGKKFIKDI